jgi:glycosyl transferase family 87
MKMLRVFGAGMVGVLVLLLFRQVAGDVWGTNDQARVDAFGYDFSAYYDAADRLITTGTPYQPDQTLSGPFLAGPKGLYLYSPLPAIVVLPLTALHFHDAATIYVALQLIALLAICLLMPVSWTVRLAILAVACLAPPVDQDLNLGNISLLMTLAGVVAWRFMDKPIAAVAITVSAALRPTMALVGAWWALRGRWRLIGWMALTALVLVVLSLPFVGIQGWLDYVTVLRNATHFEEVYRNWALNAIAYNGGLPDPWPTLALVASFAIAIGALVFSLRRDRELSYVVTFTATLIASPLLWDHYMTHMLVPAAFMASRGRWYAIVLPLLCILPQQWLPVIAIVGVLVPFLAPDRGEPAGTLLERWPFKGRGKRSSGATAPEPG